MRTASASVFCFVKRLLLLVPLSLLVGPLLPVVLLGPSCHSCCSRCVLCSCYCRPERRRCKFLKIGQLGPGPDEFRPISAQHRPNLAPVLMDPKKSWPPRCTQLIVLSALFDHFSPATLGPPGAPGAASRALARGGWLGRGPSRKDSSRFLVFLPRRNTRRARIESRNIEPRSRTEL